MLELRRGFSTLVLFIPAFVMYCVNGASRSSLLIESTDSMIPSVNPGIIMNSGETWNTFINFNVDSSFFSYVR